MNICKLLQNLQVAAEFASCCRICKLLQNLQVAAEFASCCALQVSEAALVKTEGLADEALRLGRS